MRAGLDPRGLVHVGVRCRGEPKDEGQRGNGGPQPAKHDPYA